MRECTCLILGYSASISIANNGHSRKTEWLEKKEDAETNENARKIYEHRFLRSASILALHSERLCSL